MFKNHNCNLGSVFANEFKTEIMNGLFRTINGGSCRKSEVLLSSWQVKLDLPGARLQIASRAILIEGEWGNCQMLYTSGSSL